MNASDDRGIVRNDARHRAERGKTTDSSRSHPSLSFVSANKLFAITKESRSVEDTHESSDVGHRTLSLTYQTTQSRFRRLVSGRQGDSR